MARPVNQRPPLPQPETGKAPGPSQQKHKQAPTPPPINVTKGMPKVLDMLKDVD